MKSSMMWMIMYVLLINPRDRPEEAHRVVIQVAAVIQVDQITMVDQDQ